MISTNPRRYPVINIQTGLLQQFAIGELLFHDVEICETFLELPARKDELVDC